MVPTPPHFSFTSHPNPLFSTNYPCMNRRKFLSLSVNGCIGATALGSFTNRLWADGVSTNTSHPETWVAFGDSITEGMTYPLWLSQSLAKAGRPTPAWVNAGIGGNTAAQTPSRRPRQPPDQSRRPGERTLARRQRTPALPDQSHLGHPRRRPDRSPPRRRPCHPGQARRRRGLLRLDRAGGQLDRLPFRRIQGSPRTPCAGRHRRTPCDGYHDDRRRA